MRKLFIKLTEGTRKSRAAKALANVLTQRVGYKVWRSTLMNPKKIAIKYGPGVDKLTQFNYFAEQGLSTVPWTSSPAEALEWLTQEKVVFGRRYLNASCGKGIVIYYPGAEQQFEQLPLYTQYKKKAREFRVHIFRDSVVAVAEKRKRKGWDGNQEAKIRNLENGYVFCQENLEPLPAGLTELALKASKVTSSDFRGVDIIYNKHEDKLYVLEVNSSPGIEGSNVSKYVNVILEKTQNA